MELPTLASFNLAAALPMLIVAGWAIVVLTADLFIPSGHKHWTAWLSLVGLVGAGVVLGIQFAASGQQPLIAFNGMFVADGFALFLQAVFLFSAFVSILLAVNYLSRRGIERGEYYTLLLFTTTGMMLMSAAADMIVVFLALELLSIPLYVLSGLAKPDIRSEEAAMKYFLLGAFASGFFVYGIALIYGGTGTTALTGILGALAGDAPNMTFAVIGLGLVLVGLGFKVAAAPFHMWTPDVYQGAPTPVTAFMSVGAKAGGFAALLRVLITAFPSISAEWGTIIAVLALLTMILGNFIAVSQTDIKRMLAYSSIAHAGYILVAVAAAQFADVAPFAASAAAFYLFTYALTNLGAFAVIIAIEHNDGSGTAITDFSGLAHSRPLMAAAMLLFMLSLTGLPPSAGMVGKFFVFQAALMGASRDPLLLAVVIVGVLTSVVSAFYYIRVVIMMYMREGKGHAAPQPALLAALAITTIGTFAIGIIPAPIFQIAQKALLALSS
ncbi:MAG: NADH-quinone oxidoreductase subunit N [Anaerolineae bacterium]|nr:NADH-quinone oxidoreductase subunit N [Anaerolineae bacterium]